MAVRKSTNSTQKTMKARASMRITIGWRRPTDAEWTWSRSVTRGPSTMGGSSRRISNAVTSASAYGVNASRQPPRALRSPPRAGKMARHPVRTAAFMPMMRPRSVPVQWSPITMSDMPSIDAEPMPWTKRKTSSSSKVGARPDARPPIPNRTRLGSSTALRPKRSARMPPTGASTMAGRGLTATRIPASPSGRSKYARMSGIDAMISVLAMIPVAVIEKISHRGGRRVAVSITAGGRSG